MPREILLVEEHTLPIVVVNLVLRAGALADPVGKEGLAFLTAQMLTRGAGALSQEAIADALDFLGSSLSASVGRETMGLGGDALVRNLDTFVGLMARVLLEPTFPADELDKVKRQTLAELAQVRDNDSALCQRAFVRTLFAGHPYGRPAKGTEESIARITRDDLVAFHAEHYRGSDVLVGAAGDKAGIIGAALGDAL